jgi:diadenosine tetraphosphate (Ap4A) HIT family hydrolase
MKGQDGTCYSCGQNARLESARPDQAIWVEGGWVVAHSFNSALPGWLVVVPLRHVESMHALSQSEAQALGDILRRMSAALVEVLGCLKTYVVMYAEAPGFTHLHVHVVPRAADLPEESRGGRIFEYLHRPEDEWASQAERQRLALLLRQAARSA